MKSILHVEDSEEDAFLFARALRKAKLTAGLVRVADADAAMDCLLGAGRYSDRGQFPIPDVLLLDIKLPGASGLDVLKWARANEQYRGVLIFMLSSSPLEEDISEAKALGADRYFMKTAEYADILEALRPILGQEDFQAVAAVAA